jgi:hypothetical protein
MSAESVERLTRAPQGHQAVRPRRFDFPELAPPPKLTLPRCGRMATIETLRKKMESAALALDFEEAKQCRDLIATMRGGATSEEAEDADFTGLKRQEPGAMGLGTSQQRLVPPVGWKRPAKPDPMTAGRSSRNRRRQS